jgi:hypothetical protein
MKIKKFNESWFSKKSEEIKPMGVRSTIPRPETEVVRLSDEELRKQREEFNKSKSSTEKRVDPYFLQEISDRLFGPDSEEYTNAIIELNKKFRPREGKTGHDIFR